MRLPRTLSLDDAFEENDTTVLKNCYLPLVLKYIINYEFCQYSIRL